MFFVSGGTELIFRFCRAISAEVIWRTALFDGFSCEAMLCNFSHWITEKQFVMHFM